MSLFVRDSVYGKRDMHDAVIYRIRPVEHVGVLEPIFVHSANVKYLSFVFMKLLKLTDPDSESTSAVHKFDINCYRYCVSRVGFILMNLLPPNNLPQPIVLVVDPYWLKVEHDINHCLVVISEYNALQHTLPFFRIHRLNIYERKQQKESDV